jgi:fumarate hydratase class I
MTSIKQEDLIQSIADAFQYISYYHPLDFIKALGEAYDREESPAAKDAIAQILTNSRMSAEGHRPICQDTGIGMVFLKVGMNVRWDDATMSCRKWSTKASSAPTPTRPTRCAPRCSPIRPARARTPRTTPRPSCTTKSFPATTSKSSARPRAAARKPRPSSPCSTRPTTSSTGSQDRPDRWAPAGARPASSASASAARRKRPCCWPRNRSWRRATCTSSRRAGAKLTRAEELRLELYEKINALGIGAQGLGGLTTVLDVKVLDYPCHAANLPVALVPNCAATRHVHFHLDGTGPAKLEPPKLSDWPAVTWTPDLKEATRVDLNTLTKEQVAAWKPGQKLLLNGKMLTGRDAAHKRIQDMLAKGEKLPVDFTNRVIYYVGPVDPVGDEVVGPAGPTTATRMDKFTRMMLEQTGLIAMVGKSERGSTPSRRSRTTSRPT